MMKLATDKENMQMIWLNWNTPLRTEYANDLVKLEILHPMQQNML